MATVKLGMLVSAIAGSIGGTTFRRGNNYVAMQNKAKGPAKSITLRNPALPQLTVITRLWSTLDITTLTNWNNAALLFPFADKFGAIKYLSGRELFIKLVNHNFNAGLPVPDATLLSSLITEVTAVNATIQKNGSVSLEFAPDSENVLVAIRCILIRNEFSAPSYTKRKITVLAPIVSENKIIFTTNFFNQFPDAVIGQVYRMYYTAQNDFGFIGLPQYINATVIEI